MSSSRVSGALLATRRLSAGYGERVVLGGLSVRFREGRTGVILGPGGSGKSTLLRALAGAEDPSGLWVKGEVRRPPGPLHLHLQKPGPAAPSLGERLGPEPAAADALLSATWSAAPGIASLLAPWLQGAAGPLTGPLHRLAELTVSLASPAPLLLIDEPDAGLPDALREGVERQIAASRGRRTLVIVTHNLAFARAVADDVVLLIDGAVVEAGETRPFFESPRRTRTANFLRWGA